MIYGYARVSSLNQGMYGTSLVNQEDILIANGAKVVYKDSFTGTKESRPELDKLQKVLKEGDTLIIAKLDRIARSVSVGCDLINGWLERNIRVHILNMGIIDNTPAGKLTWTMFLAFAEFERDMIFERTQAGKASAKANNPDYKEGRKPIDVDFELLENTIKEQELKVITVKQAAERLGVSVSTYRNKKKAYFDEHGCGVCTLMKGEKNENIR